MDRFERLREKLHVAVEVGNKSEILEISHELDREIFKFMRENMETKTLCLEGEYALNNL